MPRLARSVFAKVPHHITQRGNRKEDVFFEDDDRHTYLKWLAEYSAKHKVDVLAYCLMTNHVHLILRPKEDTGLQKVLKPLHMRYAQYINKVNGWTGHFWQGRYFSSALDENYTWAAIRYVERNPIRAGMVEVAEDYKWSSAAAHCGLKPEPMLYNFSKHERAVSEDAWSKWLSFECSSKDMDILEKHVVKGLPCGGDSFVNKLEKLAGHGLRYKPQGRPRKG